MAHPSPHLHVLVAHSLFLLAMPGCTAKAEDDSGIVGLEQTCTSHIEYRFPDGSTAQYDGCNDVMVDATYEFDPDDPPEVRSFKLQFARENTVGDDCWIVLTGHGICGEGSYNIGPSSGTTLEFQTHDCRNVPDAYEASFATATGSLSIDSISGGSQHGNFTGRRLRTVLAGKAEASTIEGVEVRATFDLAVYINGVDAEESTCLRLDE